MRGQFFITCFSTLKARPQLIKWRVSRANASEILKPVDAEQDVKRLLLSAAACNEVRDSLRLLIRGFTARLLFFRDGSNDQLASAAPR
jgi:hypothetical protein